jgi:hypothetical protein
MRGEVGQCRGYLRIAAVDRMQVPIGRRRGRVAETAHQIPDRRARGSRQGLPGVAQIMKPEPRHASLTLSPVERLADRITAHRAAITTDEYPLGPCPGHQQHRGTISRRDGLDQGDDLSRDATGRSLARSEPAPATWHGFFTIAPPRTALFITARKKRYACMIEARPPLPRNAEAYHSRTPAGVIARSGTSCNGAQVQPKITLASFPVAQANAGMVTQPCSGVFAERLTAKPPHKAAPPRGTATAIPAPRSALVARSRGRAAHAASCLRSTRLTRRTEVNQLDGARAVMACSVVAGFCRVSTVTHSMTVSPSGCRVRNGEDERRR